VIRGIYTAASGMVAESLRTDAIANNMANVDTTGYKRDITITKDFGSMLIKQVGDGSNSSDIGSMGYGSVVDEIATIHDAGQIRSTDNPLDLAISGKGYFTVQTPNGLRYTRNGSFYRSGQNQLVTSEGYRVLGTNGPINVTGNKIVIGSDGSVKVDGVQTSQLQLVEFANDQAALSKEGNSLYAMTGSQQSTKATGSVEQGSIERSNVNVIKEMVNLIAGYRAYEINGKSVQAHDSLLDKAVNEVGKV
jgi:flagellar basal-body rod protein FlgF